MQYFTGIEVFTYAGIDKVREQLCRYVFHHKKYNIALVPSTTSIS